MCSSNDSNRLHDKRPLRRRGEQLLIRLLTILFAGIVKILPLRRVRNLGNVIGWIAFRFVPRRRRLGLANMRAVLGGRCGERELRRLLLRSAQNMAKTMLELLKMPSMSDEQFQRFAPVTGEEHLLDALEQGGVIVVTAHFGNWEALAARICRLGADLTVVARDADDSTTASIVNRSREAMGASVVGRKSVREMLRLLQNGEVLGLLPDQHAVDGNIWVPFMGTTASTAIGPALLAHRTDSVIVPAFGLRRDDDNLEIRFLPAISVPESDDRVQNIRATTEKINEIIGEQIREHPDQWLWMHRRWRTPPSEKEKEDEGAQANSQNAVVGESQLLR